MGWCPAAGAPASAVCIKPPPNPGRISSPMTNSQNPRSRQSRARFSPSESRPKPVWPARGKSGRVSHLPRRRRSVGSHHRRRRRVSGHLCHQRGRTAVGHQLPEPARSGDVRGRDHPHRRLARGQGSRGPPRRRHRHRFHRPAGDQRPGARGRAPDRFRPDPAVLGPGRQSPCDPGADRRGEGRLREHLGRRSRVPPWRSASKRAGCRR